MQDIPTGLAAIVLRLLHHLLNGNDDLEGTVVDDGIGKLGVRRGPLHTLDHVRQDFPALHGLHQIQQIAAQAVRIRFHAAFCVDGDDPGVPTLVGHPKTLGLRRGRFGGRRIFRLRQALVLRIGHEGLHRHFLRGHGLAVIGIRSSINNLFRRFRDGLGGVVRHIKGHVGFSRFRVRIGRRLVSALLLAQFRVSLGIGPSGILRAARVQIGLEVRRRAVLGLGIIPLALREKRLLRFRLSQLHSGVQGLVRLLFKGSLLASCHGWVPPL